MTALRSGDVAVVTGAASGIGRALAQELLAAGLSVVGVDRDEDGLKELVGADLAICDLADPGAFVRLLADVDHERGRIDLLANIAGVDAALAAIDADLDRYRAVLEVNFFAAAAGTLAVLPGMSDRGRGFVVNCSSDSVRTPIANESAYVASKGALSAFTESVALEARDRGVCVHILYPGFVETPMGRRSLERGMKRPPRGVVRSPAQVAAAVMAGVGKPTIDINVSRTAAMAPLLKILLPPVYRQVMRGRANPV